MASFDFGTEAPCSYQQNKIQRFLGFYDMAYQLRIPSCWVIEEVIWLSFVQIEWDGWSGVQRVSIGEIPEGFVHKMEVFNKTPIWTAP